MTNIQVFDPALCCSTGICGVDVDQALVSFSADLEWARQNGAHVERFNLAQQPMAFAEHPLVKALLETSGQEGLPLILVNGQRVLAGRYPNRDELAQWVGDTPASLFTPQVAELVAIGAAIASNCEPCFKHHHDLARKLGVSVDDMQRAVDLAQKVKDTPARAMLELAGRYLRPEGKPANVNAAVLAPTAVATKACCEPSEASAAPTTGRCC